MCVCVNIIALCLYTGWWCATHGAADAKQSIVKYCNIYIYI